MKTFLVGIAVGAGAAVLFLRKRHHDLGARTRNNIERTGQQLNELTERMHRAEALLHESEKQVHRAHQQTRSPRHRRRPA